MNYTFRTALLFISLLFFACGNEAVVENSPIDLIEIPKNNKSTIVNNTKLMILCIAKKSIFFNGSLIMENQLKEKVQTFFNQTLGNVEIFNVMVFYEDVVPSTYATHLSDIRETYQKFLNERTQERLGKNYDELLAHERYAVPFRISFNEIERKFMTESQSTSGLKCH